MKYSRQRDFILDAVMQSDRHPTAEEVYEQVRKKIPDVSLATVYRNLNQLADLHIIRRIVVHDAPAHFDRTVAYHEHMICTKCGRVVDIWPDQPLANQLLHLSKEQITGYDLVLYGLCQNCAQSG